MSVHVMARVWAESKQTGGALLVLLAIADYADDNGKAFPSVPTLAKKARIKVRQTQRLLHKLQTDGELLIEPKAGPYGCNLYHVTPSPGVSSGTPRNDDTPAPDGAEGVSSEAGGVSPETPGGVPDDTLTIIEPRKEPSVEPPKMSRASARSPVREIFEYWKDRLKHPQAILTAERERVVRARLKEGYTVEQIKQAVDACALSPFHMGQNNQQRRYDDLTLICRTGAKLESFLNLGGAKVLSMRLPPAPSGPCHICKGSGVEHVYNFETDRDDKPMPCSGCGGRKEKAS